MDAEPNKKDKLMRAHVLASGLEFDESRYEFSESFVPANVDNPMEVHTTAEMVASLERNKNIALDARVLGGLTGSRKILSKSISRESFIDSYKNGSKRFKESGDDFALDMGLSSGPQGLVGDDFTPFLGGPFYKNLYYYQDYIRMHSNAFYAWNHDAMAKSIVNITRDFTLGRGYRVDSDNKLAMAVWSAFEEANDFQAQFEQYATEMSIYGESMFWFLPDQETKITYRLPTDERPPTGLIPRVRLIDPSNIVEIVTYPEDISRRLFYVWLAPTQYQMYTGAGGTDGTQSAVQPSLKYIYRQIPADQILHSTVNTVSNEKRGRSDFYAALGYMKRLRDAINYGIIGLLKQAAYSVDTEIDGNQSDIDNYVDAQKAMGTYAPAGSEFVHSKQVIRKYLSPDASGHGKAEIYEWLVSMISASVQIPVSYFGLHLSGGQTRASAIVSTEPVAKKFEMRQLRYQRDIRKVWNKVMKTAGLGDVDCEVTFPDIITQDRSQKLKDLALAQTQLWLKPERAAEIAAKELGIDDYEWEKEMKDMEQEKQYEPIAPLTAPGSVPGEAPAPAPQEHDSSSALTSNEKRSINQHYG